MKKATLLAGLLLTPALASADNTAPLDDHPYDDFINGAPARIAAIPTSQNKDFKEVIRLSVEREALYVLKNYGAGNFGHLSGNSFTPYRTSSGFKTDVGKAYSTFIKEYDEANAFARRRMQAGLDTLTAPLSNDDYPFDDLEGKQMLLWIGYRYSHLPFDFDSMSKSILLPNDVCGFSTPSNWDDNLGQYEFASFGTSTERGQCKVTVSFGNDEVLAEQFEVAASEGTLKVFGKVEYISESPFGRRAGIINELVFAKSVKKDEHHYVEKSNLGYSINKTQELEGYEYLTSLKPIGEAARPTDVISDLREGAFTYIDSEEDKKIAIKDEEKILNRMAKQVSAGHWLSGRVSIDGQPYQTATQFLPSGEMVVIAFKKNKDGFLGAAGIYQWSSLNQRSFATLKSLQGKGSYLPRYLYISGQNEGLAFESADYTRLIVGENIWNSDDVKMVMSSLGFDQQSAKPFPHYLVQGKHITFKGAVSETRKEPVSSTSPSNTQQEVSDVSNTEPENTATNVQVKKPVIMEPPYRMTCDMQDISTEGKRYLTRFKGKQPLGGHVDSKQFLQRVMDYSVEEGGKAISLGRTGNDWIEVKQSVGRRGTIVTIYGISEGYFTINSAFPDKILPNGDVAEDALCQMIEKL